MNDKDDDYEKIPVGNRCQYLLYMRIPYEGRGITTYELMKYGRTLDMCARFGMGYNAISRLTDMWEGLGLIEKKPIFDGAMMKLLKKTRKGFETGEKLRRYFDGD